MWKQPWGYAEGWAICAGLLITGFGLQLITGPVQAGLFQYPVNVAGGLIFLLVLCIGFVVGRKITVVQWFSGLTASITSLSALLSVVLVMGFVGPGIERITMSWPFVLLFLYFLFVLGFVTLKRIVSFRWRDVPFMLNHVGLFITLLAAILGNGDLRRLRMTVPLENPEWRASDEKNEMIELPLAIELRSFTIDEYPPKLMLIDNTTGKALPEKQPENILVEEIPLAGNLQGWKVEVTRSLPMAACVMGQDTINFVEFHSEGATTALYVKARNELTGTWQGMFSDGQMNYGLKDVTIEKQEDGTYLLSNILTGLPYKLKAKAIDNCLAFGAGQNLGVFEDNLYLSFEILSSDLYYVKDPSVTISLGPVMLTDGTFVFAFSGIKENDPFGFVFRVYEDAKLQKVIDNLSIFINCILFKEDIIQ